jgi:uncharacterized membrane protein (UPF0136 family)
MVPVLMQLRKFGDVSDRHLYPFVTARLFRWERMPLIWDTMTFANLVLCVVIFILGVIGYQRKDSNAILYIGIAFGLFGISHLATLLGFREILEGMLIWVRTIGYLVVIIAVASLLTER